MKNNKIWTALLSLAIALSLWFYVVTVVKPDTTNTYYNIPVVLDGERILTENNLMIVGGGDTTVTMELYGNRTDLDKVNSGNITLIADLSKIYEAGEVELTYSHRFPGDVPSGALTVQSKSPSTIKLTVAERASKEVPVKMVLTGEAPDPNLYIVDEANPELDITSVRITGPKDVVEQIDHAAVVVDLTGKTQTFKETYRITLCDAEGNGVDAQNITVSEGQENVSVTLNIYKFKNVRLDVEVIDGGGATKATSKIDISPATIKVYGTESALSKLTSISLGTVNLGELAEGAMRKYTIPLDEGFTNLSGETEATVTFSFPNLGTKELYITNIQALNVPEGMSYALLAQELKVTVRGPKDQISKVLASDLTATIDFTGAVASTKTYTPVITVDTAKHPNVGVFGTYSLGVTLREGVDPASTETP